MTFDGMTVVHGQCPAFSSGPRGVIFRGLHRLARFDTQIDTEMFSSIIETVLFE